MPYVDPYSQLYDEYTQRAARAPQTNTSSPLIPPGASSLPTPTAADYAARDAVSTRTVFGPGGSVTTDTRPAVKFNANSGAPAFQGAFMDDPFYQRSDVQPFLQATNRDVLGNGKYGARGWMTDHPGGVIAAMIAAAAGGSALSGYGLSGYGGAYGGGGAGLGGGAGQGVGMVEGGGELSSDAALGSAVDSSVGAYGGGAAEGAGVGFGGAGTAGLPSDLAGDFAAANPYGGAAGQLAANGGISGGAGTAGSGLAGSTWGRLLTGAGRQLVSGGSNGGGQQAATAPAPTIGGFMGSPMASQSYSAPQRTPLNESTTRARGYMRTPVQFNGATVWL